jgi:hypothetical protein
VLNLEKEWLAKRKQLLAQPEKDRDKNAYFKTLLYAFRFDLLKGFAVRVGQIGVDFG